MPDLGNDLTNEPLPAFRYHPEPVTSGSVEEATVDCVACGKRRSHVYVGPVYAEDDYSGRLCPWCLADGTAARKLGAAFTEVGTDVPPQLTASVLDELAHRTPGFEAWQQEHWMFHCDDACAFVGRIGRGDLDELPDALEMLLHENDAFGWSPEQSQEYVDALEIDGETTAYLFRCLACGTHQAYSDAA